MTDGSIVTPNWRQQSLLVSVLFPNLSTRVSIALFLTFFPYGIVYSQPYPVSELLILVAWLWTFPSRIGCFSFLLLLAVTNQSAGYFCFNLFCGVANLSIAYAVLRSGPLSYETVVSSYKSARLCMVLSVMLCALQAFSSPEFWMSSFPGVTVIPHHGAGLRSEPSLLAGPVLVYLALLILRTRATEAASESTTIRMRVDREAILIIVAILVTTLSLSVLMSIVAVLPALLFQKRRLRLLIFAIPGTVLVGIFSFGARIREALQTSGGSFLELITSGLSSWRAIPDILVIMNYKAYLWPSAPSEVRSKLNGFATSWLPDYVWLENTYSMFSACATTVGLIATVGIFCGGIVYGLSRLVTAKTGVRITWTATYLLSWLILPKYDPCGWIALAMLPALVGVSQRKLPR